jgi:hypothetical protein
MTEGVDDYLSDAFLIEASSSKEPLSYTEQRKRAQRESERRNLENRKRSRKDLEETALQEGLRRSLFERAQDETDASAAGSSDNKAMKMMLKMGYKLGQSLGKVDSAPSSLSDTGHKPSVHRTEPIPIHIWSGR